MDYQQTLDLLEIVLKEQSHCAMSELSIDYDVDSGYIIHFGHLVHSILKKIAKHENRYLLHIEHGLHIEYCSYNGDE